MRRESKGAVAIAIVSPTRGIMVKFQKSERRQDPLAKLIVETIEMEEEIMDAIIRGAYDETGKGIRLRPEQIQFVSKDSTSERGKYTPHFVIARVSEDELDAAKDIADDDGEPMDVFKLPLAEMAGRKDLLPQHTNLLWMLEMELERVPA